MCGYGKLQEDEEAAAAAEEERGRARKEGEGELAEAVRTAAPAAAAVGAAGAEAGRDLCSSGIHDGGGGGVNWLSGCRLLWDDDGGGSACQGEAKEDWEKAKE